MLPDVDLHEDVETLEQVSFYVNMTGELQILEFKNSGIYN